MYKIDRIESFDIVLVVFLICVAVALSFLLTSKTYNEEVKYTIYTDVGEFKCYDFDMVNDTCIIVKNDLTPMTIYSKTIKIKTNEKN